MEVKTKAFIALSALLVTTICGAQRTTISEEELKNITQEQIDHLGITDINHLSSASMRALKWPTDLGNEWFIEFSDLKPPLKGDLAYEEGVVRRDPSAVIRENGKYYVWYSKSTGPTQGFGGNVEEDKVFPWDRCDIWYATSEDGETWKEEGLAVARGGKKGAYDDRSVFTVEIMKHENKYYLCYQTVKSPYTVRVKNQIGLAWADSPDGPWTKSKEPFLVRPIMGFGKERNKIDLPSRKRVILIAIKYMTPVLSLQGKIPFVLQR